MTSHRGQIFNYIEKIVYKLITFISEPWRRHIINLHEATILIFDKVWFDHICVPHCVYNCKFKQPTWSTCNIIIIKIHIY